MATRGWNDVTAADLAKMGRQAVTKPIAGAGKAQAGRSPVSMASGHPWTDQPVATGRRAKYGAVKTTVDGIVFASKAEARRYATLRVMEHVGQIHDLELQPVYPLIVAGVTVGKYLADFRYYRADGELVVEDVKGMASLPTYRLKRKIVEAFYGIHITEIK